VIEVELKARLRDPAAVSAAVATFARLAGAVDKRDSYWHGPGWKSDSDAKTFRTRGEGGTTVVTYKVKSSAQGVEVNRESEFEVSDPETFAGFARRLGCEPSYQKRKTGFAFKAGPDALNPYEATIEVVEVDGIGHFIEIEVLLADEEPAALARARTEIRALLARAGVDEQDIESRFYSELLADAGIVPRA
jgi:predicted adenylyl cyclase CyaB